MSKTKSTVHIPPYSRDLFPHRTFPPWMAIARIFELLAPVLQRESTTSIIERLEAALIDASERIVIVAGGDMPARRWFRRIGVSIAYCERAWQAVDECTCREGLTRFEAAAIRDGLDEAIALLVDAAENADIPAEIRAELPELRPQPPRVLH
jgi:hypothetical protein